MFDGRSTTPVVCQPRSHAGDHAVFFLPHSRPELSPLREGSVLVPSSDSEPLFLPGTDDEEGQVHDHLVTGQAAFFEDNGAANDLPSPNDNAPSPAQHEQMDIDGDEPQSSDEASSPPTKTARRLRQEPRISFIFDDATGDLVEPHPTIFLPRPATTPPQGQDLRRSIRSHVSPVNPDAAYLKAVQGPKVDAKKKQKKKDVKGKDQILETNVPRKRARTEEDTTQAKDTPKKPKLQETVVIEDDEREFFLLFVRSFLNFFSSCRSYQGGW